MIGDRIPIHWALLVLGYIASVVSLQAFFRTFTGWESQLAVVVSTVTIAVLLNPPRRRIRAFVDRQFHQRNLERRSRT